MNSAASLVFHAERLHEPAVWAVVRRFAARLSSNETYATFFVYPFPAECAGRDIRAQIGELAGLGHEIGQHTHFYAGEQIRRPYKRDDYSLQNIRECLRRDHDLLSLSGVTPEGFTSGGWMFNQGVVEELISLGFVYDCSTRTPGPRRGSLPYANLYRGAAGQIMLLPTNASVGQWLKQGRVFKPPAGVIYLHDYDLLARRHRLALEVLLKLHMGSLRRAKDLARIAVPTAGPVSA
jgi:hypothetical protein